MNRRLIALVAAGLLAVVGALLVLSYVSGADRRAMQGLEPVTVLEVVEPVPEGTASEQLGDAVRPTELPATAVADGALSTLDAVAGQVATTELQPGEQLLASRFTDPETFQESLTVEVPADAHQVSVLLDSRRVLGGYLEAGDNVGVFVSMVEPEETRLVADTVLVTRVQGGVSLPEPAPQTEGAEEAPEGPNPDAVAAPTEGVMVTLALDITEAEDVVFAAEHATLWLTLQGEEADGGSQRTVVREDVLQ